MKSDDGSANLFRESDRGAVIVAAAILDDHVMRLLRSVLEINGVSSKQIKRIFDMSGPLSSFSSRTLIAYGFGLISKPVFDDLNAIRELRNSFAHSSNKVDFHSPNVAASVNSLHCVREASQDFSPEAQPLPADEDHDEWSLMAKGYIKTTKAMFVLGVRTLQIHLLEHQHAAVKKFMVMSAVGDQRLSAWADTLLGKVKPSVHSGESNE